MSKLRISRVPLTDLSYDRIKDIALDVYRHVTDPDTRRLLLGRHLVGAVLRHQDPSMSVKNLNKARNKMDAGEMAVFALIDKGTARCVGLDNSMPDLPLRQPVNRAAGYLPAKLTRRFGHLAQELDARGPNVSAWLAPSHADPDVLIDVYSRMREEAGEGAWTLEPEQSGDVYSDAIRAAGLEPLGPPQRYDDRETGGIQPLRTLFVHPLPELSPDA